MFNMMFSLFGAILIGGFVGYLSERFGFTSNGIVASMFLGVGGGVVAWLLLALTGISFGGRSMTAAIGAGVALFLAPKLGRK